jgi:5-methylcytosine-specific restriction endonuclease McrA
LTVLVEQLERRKVASTADSERSATSSRRLSRPCSRHIPASVRRSVWARDEGRCAFVGSRGRCTETSRLEFHHVIPFADGGPMSVQNLSLRCRAHNTYEAQLWSPS